MAANTHFSPVPAVLPTATPAHPSPTRVVVTRYASPLDFGITASGGTQADCFGAIMGQLRAMRDAGQIGDGACARGVTGVGPAEGTVAA